MTKDKALKLAAEMERGQFSTTLLPAAAELRRLHEENRKLKAQEALNKKAENARELGLDYEPAGHGGRPMTLRECMEAEEPEQEPVAWMHTKIDGVVVPHRPADLNRHPERWEALYKTPSPCPTCEALARTVMLDQTSHDTSPPQRKPLTDEEIGAILEGVNAYGTRLYTFARAIEAAHGIKGEA